MSPVNFESRNRVSFYLVESSSLYCGWKCLVTESFENKLKYNFPGKVCFRVFVVRIVLLECNKIVSGANTFFECLRIVIYKDTFKKIYLQFNLTTPNDQIKKKFNFKIRVN